MTLPCARKLLVYIDFMNLCKSSKLLIRMIFFINDIIKTSLFFCLILDYATSVVPESNRFHLTFAEYCALFHKLTPKNYNKHTKGWVWLQTYVKPHFKCPYEAEQDLTMGHHMNSGLIYTAIFDSPRGKITIMVETGCNTWLTEGLVFFHEKKFGSVSITFLMVINGLSLQWQTQAIFHTATARESSSVIIFHLMFLFVSAIIALQKFALFFSAVFWAGKLV